MVVRTPRSDSVPQARVEPQGRLAPTRCLTTAPSPWTSSAFVLAEHQHWDILCRKPEIPVAGHLIHFLPFWQEVIQADNWLLEVVSYGYSVELLQTPQFREVRSTQPPPAGPDILCEEV